MERNRELFNQIADLIEQHPEQYDQETYGDPILNVENERCGTAHCIGGFACAISGYKPVKAGKRENWGSVWLHDPQSNELTWIQAQKLLGLTHHEALILFDSEWGPFDPKMTVPQALRSFGDGARIE